MEALYKDTHRKFEIPYNFDPKLLAGLNILKFDQNAISCIYLPPYEFDYPCIRKNNEMPNKEEHFNHIEMIQNQFPGKIQLLLQQPNDNYLMTGELLKKYLNFGIQKFCVGSLNQAKEIKNILPEAEIIGSISMHITKEKIENNKEEYLKYFDSFVLDFSYNKNLIKIQNMPNYYKYILIINSFCNINCPCDMHWFYVPNKEKGENYYSFQCIMSPKVSPKNEWSLINPTKLELYDNYIRTYKIVERGWPTEQILRDLVLYTSRYKIYE